MSKEDTLDDILDDEPKTEEPKEEIVDQVDEPEVSEPEVPPKEEPEPQPEPTPAVDAQKDGLQAALAESRENNRVLKAQIDAMQAQVAAMTRPQPAEIPKVEAPQLPDPLVDPAGYNEALTGFLEQRDKALIAEISMSQANKTFGKAVVDEAIQAAQMQGVGQQFLNSRDPFGDVVEWHKSQKDLSEIREAGGLDAYREKLRQEFLAEAQAEQVADQIVPSGPSLAAEPNLGQRRSTQPFKEDSLKELLGNEHDI